MRKQEDKTFFVSAENVYKRTAPSGGGILVLRLLANRSDKHHATSSSIQTPLVRAVLS